jgi:hypothetical protein
LNALIDAIASTKQHALLKFSELARFNCFGVFVVMTEEENKALRAEVDSLQQQLAEKDALAMTLAAALAAARPHMLLSNLGEPFGG